MPNGEQEDIKTLLALFIKPHPKEIAKQSIEGAVFSLYRNMEVHKAMVFRSILHLSMKTHKRMQGIMKNFGYDIFFHLVVLLLSKKT